MINIDGSFGEGGGQIVRTSLALSILTGRSFSINKVRAGRAKPGLQAQHLTAVKAAQQICDGELTGAAIGAQQFSFTPGKLRTGDFDFNIGTAGSATLVLQTILPPLMAASAPSSLSFQGGTHNPMAPPFDFLKKTFLPIINRMGPSIVAELKRFGFYPAGGGHLSVKVAPAKLSPISITERGTITSKRARALVVRLPRKIAERELAIVKSMLSDWRSDELFAEQADNAASPGNILFIEYNSDHLTEVITSIGQKGLPAEAVAERAVEEARKYISNGAPVGEHLADQLLLPMAIAGGGTYVCGPLSLHATTNIDTIKKFLDIEIRVEALPDEQFKVTVGSGA